MTVLWWLLGCGGDGGGGPTGIHACTVDFAGEVVTTASVYVRAPGSAEVQFQVGDDGCVSIDRDPGDWEVQARALAGDCLSDWVAVTVEEGSVTEVTVDPTAQCANG